MDKKTKRELKKTRKQIYWFLLIMFPIILVTSFLLYYFIPSLKDNQILVIILMVALGGVGFLIYQIILAKREAKKQNAPKKHDPFAD